MKTRLLALMALLATACGQQPAQIQGQMLLAGDAAPPKDTLLVVSLDDVSRLDAPARTLARLEMDAGRDWPISYSFTLPHDSFQSGHDYAVRARVVTMDGKLLYTTDTRYSLDTRNLEQPLDITLVPIPSRSQP